MQESTVRTRHIPEDVRDAVWRRDEGKCTKCGSNENLEFDHIIPHPKVVPIPNETYNFYVSHVIERNLIKLANPTCIDIVTTVNLHK